ncbi:DUF1707 SHOCT-like domain-containing protein [Nocardiopsis halotolerans]|uniref:DUF1707 SHOCT-like domain-containing protein n=1 Tax=Nocardiopsis halotolerans TaxID=124252 RepID=UPI0003477571|nr:DUF1707 domain-containing protein [Nocardiopsis halotolerans]
MEDQRLPLNQMRASDAERDLTVDYLTTAFVEGRLDHEEYDRRVGLALGSVLLGELHALTADLPVPQLPTPRIPPSPRPAESGITGAGAMGMELPAWEATAWGAAPPKASPRPSLHPEADHTAPGSQHGPRLRHDERLTGSELSALPAPWREWGDEWRWWLGVAVVLTSVWGVVSLMGGELVPYWPLVPLGIWGAVLLASAIWPSEEEPP